jgi:hypothetical protein
MKLKNIAKSVIAASALTVASFGANAGAVATSEFTISGFGIYSSPGVLLEGIDISFSDFFGSTASTESQHKEIDSIFPDASETEFDQSGAGYTNFDFGVTDVSSAANVDFTGFDALLNPVAPMGTTFAHAEVTGNDISGATAILENSAKFSWDNGDNDAVDSINAVFSYSYLLNLVADSTVPWETGTAEAYGTFSVFLIGDNSTFQSIFDFNVTDQDLDNVAAAGVQTQDITLNENVNYTLKVAQTSDVDVRSVPEPTSLAILGLGLLGLAGASRKRKS